MVEIKVPSPGESITTVTLAAWLVADGDYVEKNQEVAEIDSDKATLSISASAPGVIKILVAAGEKATVGEVIGQIIPAPASQAAVSKKAEGAGTGAPREVIPGAEASTMGTPETAAPSGQEGALQFTPLARAYMQSEGLTEQDVIRLLQHQRIRKSDLVGMKADILTEGGGAVQELDKDTASGRTERREKMTPLRIKLSQRLVGVKNETAMLTTFNEVDMSEVLRIRSEFGKGFEQKHGVKLGLMAFFAKAATIALTEFPGVNAFIDQDDIVYHDFVDISIAVSAPKGLVVPVVRDTQGMSLAAIELEIRRLADKARNNRLTLEEMSGGTFTITNGGVFGSMLSTPIINPPQSAILGMHNIVERPVAIKGKVEVRPVMFVALSYDHRIIDGRESVSFLVRVKELIENPLLMALNANPYHHLLGF